MMENHGYAEAVQVPYLKELMQKYAYARNYTAVSHPSLPNYIAAISGEIYGLRLDCSPGVDCHVTGVEKNLADQLEAAGFSWKAYLGGMPEACWPKNEPTYGVVTNPFIYFDSIRDDQTRCKTKDVPFEDFQSDLDSGNLPDFAWISPDLCQSMHSKCGGLTSRSVQGEEWLKSQIPRILAAPQFQKNGLIVIAFDEGVGDAGCCGAPGGGNVLVLLISSSDILKSGGYVSDVPYNHYSLLRTLEDNWGLEHLGRSGDADVQSMSDFFK